MLKPITLLFCLTLATSAFAQTKGAPAAAPAAPEIQKTVDAFFGKWTFDVSMTMPDAPQPMKTKMTFNCAKTALGKAVACTMKMKMPQMGQSEGTFLIGYDTWSKAVHFMAMTSDDEIHDHKCMWKDDKNLVCDPLKGGLQGQPIVEDLSIMIDGKTATFKSVQTLSNGKKVVFEGVNGKRK